MKLDLSTGCLITVEQQELDRRIRAVRDLMEEKKIGLIMVASPMKGGYRNWLTGTDGPGRPSEGAVLIGKSGNVIIVNGGKLVPRGNTGERNYAMPPETEGEAFRGYGSAEGFSAELMEELLGESRTLGIANMGALRADLREYLQKELPQAELVDISAELEKLRAVKSQAERKIMKQNARMVDKIFAGAGIYLNPLKYEREVVNDLRYAAYRLGSGGMDYLLSVPMELVSGKEGAKKEETPLVYPGRKLSFGDRVNIKLFASGDDGYFAGMARSYVLGKASPKTEKQWETAVKAQDMAAELLRPGAVVREVASRVNAFLKEEGYLEDQRSMIHGIGASVQEKPEVFEEIPMTVEENMVFYVGPTVDDGETDALSCGDLYVVDREKTWRLTEFPRILVQLYE